MQFCKGLVPPAYCTSKCKITLIFVECVCFLVWLTFATFVIGKKHQKIMFLRKKPHRPTLLNLTLVSSDDLRDRKKELYPYPHCHFDAPFIEMTSSRRFFRPPKLHNPGAPHPTSSPLNSTVMPDLAQKRRCRNKKKEQKSYFWVKFQPMMQQNIKFKPMNMNIHMYEIQCKKRERGRAIIWEENNGWAFDPSKTRNCPDFVDLELICI